MRKFAKMARLPRKFTLQYTIFQKTAISRSLRCAYWRLDSYTLSTSQFVSFPDRSQCGSKLYGLRPLLACLPAWWRFAQSLRRYSDTKQKFPHLANAGKYSTTFFVVFFSTVATTNKGIIIVIINFFVFVFCFG